MYKFSRVRFFSEGSHNIIQWTPQQEISLDSMVSEFPNKARNSLVRLLSALPAKKLLSWWDWFCVPVRCQLFNLLIIRPLLFESLLSLTLPSMLHFYYFLWTIYLLSIDGEEQLAIPTLKYSRSSIFVNDSFMESQVKIRGHHTTSFFRRAVFIVSSLQDLIWSTHELTVPNE